MTRPVAVLLLGILISTGTAQPPGEVFAPKGGRLAARFPATPRETTQATKSPLGDLQVYTATYATPDGNVFLLGYTDLPGANPKADQVGALFDAVRDGLKGTAWLVRGEKNVEVGTDRLAGRDIEMGTSRQQARFRVTFQNGRLFQAAVLGSPEFVAGKEATAFIESFEVLK